jgi:hypothetical protein
MSFISCTFIHMLFNDPSALDSHLRVAPFCPTSACYFAFVQREDTHNGMILVYNKAMFVHVVAAQVEGWQPMSHPLTGTHARAMPYVRYHNTPNCSKENTGTLCSFPVIILLPSQKLH